MNISSMLSVEKTTPPPEQQRGHLQEIDRMDSNKSPKHLDDEDNSYKASFNGKIGDFHVSLDDVRKGENAALDSLNCIVPQLSVFPIEVNGTGVEDKGDERGTGVLQEKTGTCKSYLEGFERKVNRMNKLDKLLIKSNCLKILEQEEAYLQSIISQTKVFADNYVERTVVDDYVSKSNILGGEGHTNRDFRWGSTRDLKIEELPVDEETPAILNAGIKKSPAKSRAKKQEDEQSKVVKKPSAKSKRRVAANTDANDDDGSLKKRRKTRANSISSNPDEKQSNGKVKLKINLKNEKGDDAGATEQNETKISAKEQKILTKQYDNTFVAIWKDLSRKDGPKVSRLMQQSSQAKLINLKKTAILAAREAKRWQLRNNKNQKDLTTKARRAMREMFNFWKRNERIERELRKKYEKELIDKAKKEEEEREAKRQSRKLNFLITQTELYSHFIGKKIKTSEFEGKDTDAKANVNEVHQYDQYADLKSIKQKDFSSIDFENDDDEALKAAAAANAHMALESARSKAQSFDKDPLKNPDTNGEEMNFQNPALMGDINIPQPEILKCNLKEYQLKGLNWLANLYEQGINGILADEMGLGKTVQSISVLAYLAETHNIWGPFLVVTPASTLHNWQQEITRFVPEFKVIPYWGNAKDRRVLRKFWDRKNVRYTKDSPFHVLVTSYQLVVADAAYFQKMKWQYMILDEAQAIKSSSSTRWKSLLSFSCRNRLLLTGTPIQNSMQELWALLHFIMPSLFDSHDEFSDWFSKDIESHAQSNTKLNEQQLKRLHVILKPFMLRRIKKNVQSELGDKKEIDVFCDLTYRQKKYYQMLKSQISIMDLLDSANSSSDEGAQSLMNLVMQFRKVCNHPDLFERADVQSSFAFNRFAETGSFLRESNDLELYYTSENPIDFGLPKMLYEDLMRPSFDNKLGGRDKLLYEKFNIYHPDNIRDDKLDNFGWLPFVDTSSLRLQDLSRKNILERAIENSSYTDINYSKVNRFKYLFDDPEDEVLPQSKKLLIHEYESPFSTIVNSKNLNELYDIQGKVYEDLNINTLKPAAEPIANAPPITLECSNRSFAFKLEDSLFDLKIKDSLMPLSLNEELYLLEKQVPVPHYPKSNMIPYPINTFIDYSNIRMPSKNRFIAESGKLSKLDELLTELKKHDHRVLIYFQMTKMMDLMEEYLTYKQHKYIRLDGSSKLDDRRDLVHDWQTRPEIFVFLLSTRAGGLGINLTAADTVIFYDSDWNPTIDSQAMDRAHRLGQTKQVTVYRLLTRGTIEERMRDRAKQKEQVQQVVMEGKSDIVTKDESGNKKKDVAFLLLGENDTIPPELNESSDSTEDNKKQSNNSKSLSKNLEDLYHEGEGEFSSNATPGL